MGAVATQTIRTEMDDLRDDVDRLADDVRALREAGDARALQLGELAEDVATLRAQSSSVGQQLGEIRSDLRGLHNDLRADLRAERRQTLIIVVVALALVAGIALGSAQIDLLGVSVGVGAPQLSRFVTER